jgi:coenzyme PQQ synthesis protein D (PqqD)
MDTSLRPGSPPAAHPPAQRWLASASVLFRDLGDEAVLLELESGQYFGLDEMGTRIWHLLAEHGEVQAICDALLGEYEVTAEELHRDVAGFVDLLHSKHLIEVDAEPR